MNTTSLSLLDRLRRAGPDSVEWRKLQDIYLPLIRGWLAHVADLRDEAEDLSQEVLVVLFRELPGFERRRDGIFSACGPLRPPSVASRRGEAVLAAGSCAAGSPAHGPGTAPGRVGADGAGDQLQRLGSAGPGDAGADQPNRQPAPLGPRHSLSAVVPAADATRPRCHYSGGPDAHCRLYGLAQAAALVA